MASNGADPVGARQTCSRTPEALPVRLRLRLLLDELPLTQLTDAQDRLT